MAPKSMKQILLSGRMMRLAGCGSAWKKSSSCVSRFMITDDLARQLLGLDALTAQSGQELPVVAVDGRQELPHPHAGHELADHHFFGAVLEMHPWRGDVLLALFRASPENVGVARFRTEIHFVEEDGLEVFPEAAVTPGAMMVSVSPTIRIQSNARKIGGDQRTDAGPPHLHRHALAASSIRLGRRRPAKQIRSARGRKPRTHPRAAAPDFAR